MKKVALITGASRGLGRCLAEGLGADGYRLLLFSKSKAPLEAFANTMRDSEIECETFPVDLSNPKELESSLNRALSIWGRIDVLCNNAGVNFRGTLTPSVEEFSKLLDVNVRGAYQVLQAVVPVMKHQKSGYIFNISSVCGKTSFPGSGAYCSSKFALQALNEALFSELTPLGIRVSALCPSWIDTDMAFYAPIDRNQMIRPGDILHTLRFLLSMGENAVVKELMLHCKYDFE